MPLLPELVLAIGAMVMLMFGVSVGQGPRGAAIVNAFCIAILVLAGFAIAMMPPGRVSLFGGSFVVDDYARFLKLLTLTGSAGALILSLDYLTLEKEQKFEYGPLFLLATLGMLMLISASDLIALYLGLELMSLPLYVVAASNRGQRAIDRSRPEIFCARRAVVGHAALRCVADLRVSPALSISPVSPRQRKAAPASA